MQCHTCSKKNPQFCFNSVVLIIILTALGFLVAFAWNQLVREAFERMNNKQNELSAMLNYAILATFGAIIIGFLLLYFLNGTTSW